MKYALIVLMLTLAVAGCKKKTEPCTVTAGSTVAPASEEAMITTYLASNSITNAVELDNCGLYYIIDVAGNTDKPNQCSAMQVKYVGKLANGTIFDQTTGTNTANFTLGGLIEGWKRGLPLIGEGGKIRLFIPPSLGYGAAGIINPNTGQVVIPANAILIFEVEIIAVVN